MRNSGTRARATSSARNNSRHCNWQADWGLRLPAKNPQRLTRNQHRRWDAGGRLRRISPRFRAYSTGTPAVAPTVSGGLRPSATADARRARRAIGSTAQIEHQSAGRLIPGEFLGFVEQARVLRRQRNDWSSAARPGARDPGPLPSNVTITFPARCPLRGRRQDNGISKRSPLAARLSFARLRSGSRTMGLPPGRAGDWPRPPGRASHQQMVQPHRDGVGADDARLTRGAAGAEVVNVHRPLDDQARAIRRRSLLHNALEQRRRPVRGKDLAARQQRTGVLDRLPAGGLHEEGLRQLSETHPRNCAGHRACFATPQSCSHTRSRSASVLACRADLKPC